MKTLSRILFLALLLVTSSCVQGQKQLDEAEIEGSWNVADRDTTNSLITVWQINQDGSFCEGDSNYVRPCGVTGSWILEDNKFTLKIHDFDSLSSPIEIILEYEIAKEGETFSLTKLINKIEPGQDLPIQRLILKRE